MIELSKSFVLATDEVSGLVARSGPELLLDRVFLKDAVERAVLRVRDRYQAGRKIMTFLAFQEYHLAKNAEPPTYREPAKKLGVREIDVRNYLHEVREAVREEVKAEFASDGEEMPAQVAGLFRG